MRLFVFSAHITRFLRKLPRLYVLYMSVGIAAIPAGIAYGVLVVNGYDRWWTAALSVAVGLYFGRTMWKYVDAKLFWSTEVAPAITPVICIQMTYGNTVGSFVDGREALEALLKAGLEAAILENLSSSARRTADTQTPEEMYACARS